MDASVSLGQSGITCPSFGNSDIFHRISSAQSNVSGTVRNWLQGLKLRVSPPRMSDPDFGSLLFMYIPNAPERSYWECEWPLQDVWASWFASELPEDLFSAVKLAGFGLEDARARPLRWDVGFETIGDKWLGITVPFVDDVAQAAAVDT
jgi:hypothetical protein